MRMSDTRKLVIVGDGMCGKTCLFMALDKQPFKDQMPTVYETKVIPLEVDGIQVNLSLHDTAGQEEYDRLRPLAYPETDIFILCYSVDSIDSLENIQRKWLPEIKHHCPTTPFILVGNKEDLRCDSMFNSGKLVQTSEGRKMSQQIKAYAYLECSAKTNSGILDVFHTAVRATSDMEKRPRKKRCQIL